MNNITKATTSPKLRPISSPVRHFIPNFFSDFIDEFQTPSFYNRPLISEAFEPQIKIDVHERSQEYLIRAQIPGAKKENIHVSIEGGYVTISAENISKYEERSDDERVIRSECNYGSAIRSFQLPSEVSREKSKASYENGVLSLTLPKINSSISSEIEIK